jgi:hypothetical protein
MGSASVLAVDAPRRESTPLTRPFVTGSSEENELVSSPRSSWELLEARLAANEARMLA